LGRVRGPDTNDMARRRRGPCEPDHPCRRPSCRRTASPTIWVYSVF